MDTIQTTIFNWFKYGYYSNHYIQLNIRPKL